MRLFIPAAQSQPECTRNQGSPEETRDPSNNNQNENSQQNNVPQAPTDSDNSQQRTGRSLRGDDSILSAPTSSTPTDNFGRPGQGRNVLRQGTFSGTSPENSNNPPINNQNPEPQQNVGPGEQVPVESDNSQRRPQSPDSHQREFIHPANTSSGRDAVSGREIPQNLARRTRSRERIPGTVDIETWHGITSATPPPVSEGPASTPGARSLRGDDSILDVPTFSTPRGDFGRPNQRRERTSDFHFEHFDLDSLYMDYETDIGFRLDFLENGADFEAAISATGFGRFHFCLLAITGLIYANTAVGITIISFVLPAATCDFRMTSADKGWLTAAPMLGMVIGSYFWGCLADTKGRKTVLVSTLLLDGFIGIVSSFVQILPIFMACRFINGFSVAGAMGICFPYLGEFQQTKYREKILCWMEMFWTLGVIVLPLIAWGIIPIEGIRIEHGEFSYDSWNWFVAACGVPSLCLGFWLLTFPESPKFMMECGDYDDALECLKGIYKINTGDDRNNYPIKSLKEKQRTTSVASQSSQKSVRSLKMTKRKDLKRLFSEIWTQTKALCRPPYLKYTVLTCFIQFGLTTSYYTLMIWFPELFNRYEEFESRFPNTSASVCDVSSIVVVDEASSDPFDCLKTIDQSVYMHTLIVGLACIPTSLWLPLCVHKLGAKFFLIFSLGFAGVVTVGLYYVNNSTQNLVLSCIFEALTSLAISLVFCVLVDLFPTNLRVMAAALSLTAGRGGGLIGNLSFGYLIDINCVVPIVVFAAFLFMAAVLCFFLPKTGQEALD